MKEFAMKRFLPGLVACFLLASAHAQTPAASAAAEPPVDSNPVGTIIFAVLFVGFCVVFAWMVWRNKDKDKKQDGNPQT
jgi:heme/copper-type cytochrome/quinol oxidase subunit 2